MAIKFKHKKSAGYFLLSLLGIATYCFLLFWLTGIIFESTTDLVPISRAKSSFYLEPISLLFTFIVLFMVTRRVAFSIILLTFLYILILYLNAEMMNIFELPFTPSDFRHSLQLILAPESWFNYLIEIGCILVICGIIVCYFFKSQPNKYFHKYQYLFYLLLISIFTPLSLNHNEIADFLQKKLKLSGKAMPINLPEHHGFLFAFYFQLLKQHSIKPPHDYSLASVNRIADKYFKNTTHNSSGRPDVIIFFIEAFADPLQMDIKTSYDPIPNFHKYAQAGISGLVISPEIGGRSANPEFELLTGMSMRFLPEKSIPYIDHINRPIPSIARVFNNNGYESTALHVASMDFFNYKKIYRFLGFDKFYSLHNRQGMELDPAGRYPSEMELVKEIIKLTDQSKKPQFIFSFPNSTHGFWDYDAYLESDLNVYGHYSDIENNHIKTYINALHSADKAIGKLINHYANSEHPTIIMVLGDHQPGLPEFRQSIIDDYLSKKGIDIESTTRKQRKRAFRKIMRKNKPISTDPELYIKNHQVPFLIWSNQNKHHKNVNTSMNFLSALLFNQSAIKTEPFYALVDELFNNLKHLSKFSKINNTYQQITDYEYLQNDILFWNNYYCDLYQCTNPSYNQSN